MIKKAIKSTLRRMGFSLYRSNHFDIRWPLYPIGFDEEEVARQNIHKIRNRSMVAYSSLVSLWQQIKFCEETGLTGDYVECGVWKGGSIGLMALANQSYGASRRPIHLFDAFDDICEPDPSVDGERALAEVEKYSEKDRQSISGQLTPLEGIYDHLGGPGQLDDVKRFLVDQIGYDPAKLVFHKGWFQDTVPVAEISKIAVLRLDGDWYASTKVCLDNLYDKVVSGGFVVIDDYGCYEGCRKAVDEFLASQSERLFLNHVNKDCRYWIKP